MNIKHLLRYVLALLLLVSGMTVRAASDVRKPENRVIYEVFVRNFSPAGNFKGVEAQIPRLKELGVDVVWLMPIYKLGETGKWGTYSSPYAVQDYRRIDPANGSESDFRDLVNAIHANGMEVWLDWVANHTSLDAVWTTTHPEFYERNGNSFVNPYGWSDVYQLKRDSEAMQNEMISCMQYWVDNFGVDGFRCDYASGPSPELWRKASQQVLKNGKRVAWLAEDDSMPQLVSNGWFDYNYAWAYHDRLLDFARGVNVNNLKNESMSLHTDNNYKGRSRMVYLTNHDVVQDKGGTEDRLFGQYLRPLTVLEFTIYGMPLIYNGQEIQYKSNGMVSLAEKTPIDWSNPDNGMNSLIKTLCHLKHTQPALNTGAESGMLINHNASDGNVYVYERRSGNSSVVVMLNFNNNATSFSVTGNLPNINGRDVFSGNTAALVSGASFSLPALGYAVYVADEGNDDLIIIEQPETHKLYIRDLSGWNQLYVYAWANGQADLLGGWPGTAASQSETINGVTYKVINYPAGLSGSYNFIFHNNSGTQFDGPYLSTANDSYVEITSDSFRVTDTPSIQEPEPPVVQTVDLYVRDLTGWNKIYVYAYHNDQPSIFGEWPGREMTETASVNGTTYKVIRDLSISGDLQELIFNNGNGEQVDGPKVTFDKDVYATAEVVSEPEPPVVEEPRTTCNLYIKDLSGWNQLYVYAYRNNAPSIFGVWPGKHVSETMTINGESYRVIRNIELSKDGQRLIFNNNQGAQFDGPEVTFNDDIFIEIGSSSYRFLEKQEVKYYNIYVMDRTGWNQLYLYAYHNDAPSLFGEWPGALMSEKTEIGGTTYKVIRNIPASEDYHHFIFHNNEGDQFDASGTHPVTGNIFLEANPTNLGTTDSSHSVVCVDNQDCEYYTIQGVRVAEPSRPGIYIVKCGTRTSKMVIR